MSSLISVNFGLFPDNHPLPATFTLGGIEFSAVHSPDPLFINETSGIRGLQFRASGLMIKLPNAVNSVFMEVGGFGGPVNVVAKDQSGTTLTTQTLTLSNSFVRFQLNAIGITQIVLIEGNNEAVCVEIIVPC
jgi:hypothetical protein